MARIPSETSRNAPRRGKAHFCFYHFPWPKQIIKSKSSPNLKVEKYSLPPDWGGTSQSHGDKTKVEKWAMSLVSLSFVSISIW